MCDKNTKSIEKKKKIHKSVTGDTLFKTNVYNDFMFDIGIDMFQKISVIPVQKQEENFHN